jgi:hypothetical protein
MEQAQRGAYRSGFIHRRKFVSAWSASLLMYFTWSIRVDAIAVKVRPVQRRSPRRGSSSSAQGSQLAFSPFGRPGDSGWKKYLR